MEKHVRSFLRSALILLTLGISVQTNAQPEVLTTVPANSRNFITVGNLVYFHAGNELWRTDGTAEGTTSLGQNLMFYSHSVVSFNDLALFQRSETSDLWRSDGTPEGTFLLGSFGGKGTIRFLGQTNDYVFFQAFEASTGTEIYRTDGTVEGTIRLTDLGAFGAAAVLGDVLFFEGGDDVTGMELWMTDGTEAGTTLVKDINPGPGDAFLAGDPFFVYGNRLFFSAFFQENHL